MKKGTAHEFIEKLRRSYSDILEDDWQREIYLNIKSEERIGGGMTLSYIPQNERQEQNHNTKYSDYLDEFLSVALNRLGKEDIGIYDCPILYLIHQGSLEIVFDSIKQTAADVSSSIT